eukprot:m.858223 g.858223  ORF g.858223 m.858223 type:complete len:53 (+) comp23521_c1_seq1:565-723(+)
MRIINSYFFMIANVSCWFQNVSMFSVTCVEMRRSRVRKHCYRLSYIVMLCTP